MSTSDMLYFYTSLENDTESELDDDINSQERCMITQTPLYNDYVTLECGHKFNYDAIFNDIYNHKKRFHELETSRLQTSQIRCPYCRNIQNSLLPCPSGKKMVCGVNVIIDIPQEQVINMRTPSMFWLNYRHFAKGYCCYGVSDISKLGKSCSEVTCSDTMVMYNDVDERVYCKTHLKEMLTSVFNNSQTNTKKEVSREKREIASIIRQEKLLAKKKAALIEKQEITQKTMGEVQSWYSNKMFLLQTSNNINPIPENVVVSSSINIPTAAHTSTNGVTQSVGYEKPVNRCMAITVRHKTRCALKAVKGGIYCSRHKALGGCK